MHLDLNDLNSVKSFAKEFNSKHQKLDILLNNAGIMSLPKREETVQGFEKQTGVNHVGHFLLTDLLMEKIKAAPQARIVNLASLAHETCKNGGLDFDDLMWKKSYNEWQVYSASKMSNIYFTKGLAKKFEAENITNVKACSVHPGVVRTELARYCIDDMPLRKFG